MMQFNVMTLKTLFGGKGCFAALMLAQKRFSADVDEHVLFQIGMLSKLFLAKAASIFGLLLMDFTYMAVESVFGTEDELAFHAMKLPRSLMDLFHMLTECLRIQIDFSATLAGLFQGLFLGMNAILVFDEAVIRFKSFRTVPTKEWQRIMSFTAMLDDLFGTDPLGTAIWTIINSVLRVAVKGDIVP